MLFSERLKAVRNNKGITQGKLAELTGIHEKTLFRYEKGTILPTADKLKKMASVLSVSCNYFLFERAHMLGIPQVHDSKLYEKYLKLEKLNDDDRHAATTLLEALIARMRLKELIRTG
ncbi:MAG: hypothetical protein CSA81_04715 [Acidobacteria bacterium]|nr:MAG: hypothetical protein CSA81_04715 [Acidobacteriota bacterium]